MDLSKNLWHRKCVRRAIFRTEEVIRPLQPLLGLRHSRWVTAQPVRGHLTPKMNIILFYQKLDAEYFLFVNFFEKSNIFRQDGKKLFWWHIWRFFRGRRRLVQKINITFLSQIRRWIFYYLAVFSKKNSNFLRKWQNPFPGPMSLLKGRRRLGRKWI